MDEEGGLGLFPVLTVRKSLRWTKLLLRFSMVVIKSTGGDSHRSRCQRASVDLGYLGSALAALASVHDIDGVARVLLRLAGVVHEVDRGSGTLAGGGK